MPDHIVTVAQKQEIEIDVKQQLWKTELFWVNLKMETLERAVDTLLFMHSESNPERVKELLPIMRRVYRLVKKLTGENHVDVDGLRKIWSDMIDIEEPVNIEKVEKP